MKKILVIPIIKEIEKSAEIFNKYNTGYEFNDFFMPDVLDSEEKIRDIMSMYRQFPLPEYRTIHGAFFDVTVFSPDRKIREISELRVKQSLSAAHIAGAKGVVFHTNYNPFLNTPQYVQSWIDANAEYWADMLEKNPDIEFYLENMFDSSPNILEGLSQRLCRFPNYGVCLDYAHAALTAVPHEEWVSRLGRYVKHIHINDNDLISDSHLALGDGKINWNKFYVLYEKYMDTASILVETSYIDRQIKSLDKLHADGFID